MYESMCNVFRRSWPGYTSMPRVGFQPQSRYFNGGRLTLLILHGRCDRLGTFNRLTVTCVMFIILLLVT
jgi:hypothetical protein